MFARAVLGLIALVFLFSVAVACETPVYRYALERWEGAEFPVYLFHGKVFGDRDRAWADAVRRTNARLVVADVTVRPFVEGMEVYERFAKGKPLPSVVLFPAEGAVNGTKRRREKGADAHPVLAGGLSSDPVVATLPSSPAREKIVRHILAGGVAVWVVVKSGNPEKDGAFLGKLEGLLAEAQKKVVEPAVVSGAISEAWGDAVSFLVLSVDRDDPAEAFFLWQLLEEGAEKKAQGEPAAYPIFGRGRALPPTSVSALTSERIDWWAEYLTGNCSCEIKAENPGRDLIFPDVWNEGIRFPTQG